MPKILLKAFPDSKDRTANAPAYLFSHKDILRIYQNNKNKNQLKFTDEVKEWFIEGALAVGWSSVQFIANQALLIAGVDITPPVLKTKTSSSTELSSIVTKEEWDLFHKGKNVQELKKKIYEINKQSPVIFEDNLLYVFGMPHTVINEVDASILIFEKDCFHEYLSKSMLQELDDALNSPDYNIKNEVLKKVTIENKPLTAGKVITFNTWYNYYNLYTISERDCRTVDTKSKSEVVLVCAKLPDGSDILVRARKV